MTPERFRVLLIVAVISAPLLLPQQAAAHCDTMDGPVVRAARLALKVGDVTPVLKWVAKADEPQIRAAFERTLKVRALSPEARGLADNYFFETLVRVHRAGEGEPYTGLKPTGTEIEAGIASADKALDTGSVDELISQLSSDVAKNTRQRFVRVQEVSKHAEDDVEAGRRYVAAYVDFIHYIESVHQVLSGEASQAHNQKQLAEAGSRPKE